MACLRGDLGCSLTSEEDVTFGCDESYRDSKRNVSVIKHNSYIRYPRIHVIRATDRWLGFMVDIFPSLRSSDSS